MEVSGQFHAPAALPQGKSTWYPLDRRLGGPQSRSGRDEEKNSQPPPRESNPSTPIVQPVDRSYTYWAIMALAFNGKGTFITLFIRARHCPYPQSDKSSLQLSTVFP
jgi:hypothetical protein